MQKLIKDNFFSSCRIFSWLGAAAVPAVLGGFLTRVTDNFNLVTSLGMAAIFYPFVLVFSALFGGPILYMLYKRGRESLWPVLFSAAISGVALSLMLSIASGLQLHNMPINTLYAALNAFAFYMMHYYCCLKSNANKPNQ